MKKEQYFKIGEIAKIYSISVQTLRHYEDIGLLKPAYVDTDTHYRYYGYEQTEVLNTIRYLRALGTPLSSIRNFLESRSLSKMEEMLQMQEKDVESKIKILQQAQKKIKRRIQILEIARSRKTDVIYEFDAPEQHYIYLKTSLRPTSYLDLESSILSLEKDQRDTIVYLGNVGIGIQKENLINQHYQQYDSVFILLNPEDNYKGPSDSIPAYHTISILFNGNHASSQKYYEMLLEYINQRNYIPADFSREITLIDEGITRDTSQFLTQIEIPVLESFL